MKSKKTIISLVIVAVLAIPGIAYAASKLQAKPREFDPGRTFLVQAEWLSGIGCPTDSRLATPNASFTAWSGSYTPYTDPACPTGDTGDRKNEGLLLAKTGPTVANFASAIADIKGVKGTVLSELGWDIRKPGPEGATGVRGSHCGAGAPRWNIETTDGRFFFLGCNSPAADSQTPGDGYIRMRWGAGVAPLLAFEPAAGFALVDITGLTVKSLTIVHDEGYDTGPDNFGLTVLDNIDVNGTLVGRHGGGGDDDGDDDD